MADRPKGLDGSLEALVEESRLTERVSLEGDTPSDKAAKVLNAVTKGSPVVIHRDRLWEYYDAATRLSQQRTGRYMDYDAMEQDSLLASALELMTDDACQYSPDRAASVWPLRGADSRFIQGVFDEIDIENRIWGWVYNTAKYGDFFLKVNEKDGEFLGLEESVHPRDVRRLDIDGRLAAWTYQEESKTHIMDPWRFVHFMNNYKPTFETAKIQYKESDGAGRKGQDVVITSRYGTSVLEAARKIYKILNLLEQAVALARLNRAPLVRVFYINTEGLTPEERDDTVARVEQHFKQQMSLDLRNNLYQSEFKPLSFNADIFIPYAGTVGDVRTDTLGGELNIRDLADIDYLKNKLFAAIRVPKGFLGFEENVPDAGGQTTLVRLDIRYARMIKKLQRSSIAGIKRLLSVIYAYRFKNNPLEKHTAIAMETISGVEELDRMSGIERRMSVGQQMISMMRDLEGATDPTPVYEYVFSEILGMKELGLKFKQKPKEEESGPGATAFDSLNLPGEVRVLVEEAFRQGKVEELLKLAPTLYKLSMEHEKVDHHDSASYLPSTEGYVPMTEVTVKEEEQANERDDTIGQHSSS